MPVNVATGHRYRGVNLFMLGMSPLASTSGDPRWCSYRQAAARGLRIPMMSATLSNRKPATDFDLKPAGIPI